MRQKLRHLKTTLTHLGDKMKYQAEFLRVEKVLYYVDVEADTVEEAKELANEIYSDVDLSTLSQYEISGNDYLNKIVECV